jgi:hypothetical protein
MTNIGPIQKQHVRQDAATVLAEEKIALTITAAIA